MHGAWRRWHARPGAPSAAWPHVRRRRAAGPWPHHAMVRRRRPGHPRPQQWRGPHAMREGRPLLLLLHGGCGHHARGVHPWLRHAHVRRRRGPAVHGRVRPGRAVLRRRHAHAHGRMAREGWRRHPREAPSWQRRSILLRRQLHVRWRWRLAGCPTGAPPQQLRLQLLRRQRPRLQAQRRRPQLSNRRVVQRQRRRSSIAAQA